MRSSTSWSTSCTALIDPRAAGAGLSAMLDPRKVRQATSRPCSASSSCSPSSSSRVLAPLLAPYPGDVSASHLLRRLKPPSWEHPFGTDNLGRDIFSRVILGTRGALTIALMVVGISMADRRAARARSPATTRAGLSEAIMRVTDVFLAVPQLILALALAQLMGPSLRERHAGADPDLLAVLHAASSMPRRGALRRLAVHRRAAVHRRRAARASCSCTSCPTASRPSSCAPPSAWASPSWSRPCWASSAWAPRRPIPDWGLAISESRAVPAGCLVVLDLSGARHLPHRARLQPVRRRPARHRRSAAEAVAMTRGHRPAARSSNLRLSVSAPTRAWRRSSTTSS